MNYNEIDALLNKYYEGETTLSEEHLLRNLFRRSDVPEELKKHQLMFAFFDQEAKKEVSSRFTAEPWSAESRGKRISLAFSRKQLIYSLSLAASIVIIVSFTLIFRSAVFSPSQPFGTISDPELAYIETRNALELFSEKFNTGMSKTKNLHAFNKGMDQAGKLKQFNQYQPININQDNK
jgi:hypothetical protein